MIGHQEGVRNTLTGKGRNAPATSMLPSHQYARRFPSAGELHDRIDCWATALEHLGVPAAALRRRHGPCPACGGKDRFRYTDRHGHGDFYCNGCGPGDGFTLLQRLHGWTLNEAKD